jgi:hypothetical protein
LQQIYLAGKICADFPAAFFIFGSPRSGTTLLCASLELNDKIVVPDETDFVVPMGFIFDRVKDVAVGRDLIASLIVSSGVIRTASRNF